MALYKYKNGKLVKVAGNYGLVANQISAGTTLTNQNDTVVETCVSSDGSTWYRKWASGWKECGGIYTFPSGGSGNYNNFTMPITFETTPTTANVTLIYDNTNWGTPFYLTSVSNEKFGVYKYSTVAIKFGYYFAGY